MTTPSTALDLKAGAELARRLAQGDDARAVELSKSDDPLGLLRAWGDLVILAIPVGKSTPVAR